MSDTKLTASQRVMAQKGLKPLGTQPVPASLAPIEERTVCVTLVRGEDPNGGPIFAYVAVRADKLQAFMEAQKTGMFYPEDYGVIVEAGHGEPSPEIQHRMESEYSFNHQGMLDIADVEAAKRIVAQLADGEPKPKVPARRSPSDIPE